MKPQQGPHRRAELALAVLVVLGSLGAGRPQDGGAGPEAALVPQKVVQEGIAVEFTLEPVAGGEGKSAALREGDEAVAHFTIIETTTGSPLTGLRPATWMALRREAQGIAPHQCREKIQSFLQGSLRARPEIDLNSYYLLTLNHEPNLSVIDPFLGYGGSKLLALVLLESPGEDWALSPDQKRLFVTLPLADRVAVVDTTTWKVVADVNAGPKPTRLALQADGKYLWVANDATGGAKAESGVTVLDAQTLKVAGRLATGAGHHELALTPDSRYAYVTNRQDGTLAILDVQKLVTVKTLKTGPLPAALAYSPLSRAAYVAHEGDGTIVVVGGPRREIVSHMKGKPGLSALRFAPDGRWGFVANRKDHVVHIFDASNNHLLHTVNVGKAPEHIAFTQTFAYIRSAGTEQVMMIQLNGLGKEGSIPVLAFPGGQLPPEKASSPTAADPIVPTPEGSGVLVANPADKVIYYYTEGMAAPMGSFQNYRREPRAVLVVDRSLRETGPGVYSAAVKFTKSGPYDVAFLLDSPRIAHCFDVSVQANPGLKKKDQHAPVKVEPLLAARSIRVGDTVRLQFRFTDAATDQPRMGLKDVRVLTVLAPGIWQNRQWAQAVGDGIYEVAFAAPQSGVYYVFVESTSLGVRFNQLPYLTLQATGETHASPARISDEAGEGIP